MLKYDRAAFVKEEAAGVEAFAKTAQMVDTIWEAGFENIFFVGIGGSNTCAMLTDCIMKPRTTLKYYVEHATELTTVGNKKMGKGTVMFINSYSGDTPEVIRAVEYAKEKGAKVAAFINKPGTPLANAADWLVTDPGTEEYYWYAVALRLMYKNGDFPEYDRFAAEVGNMPEALADVQEQVDEKARHFAEKYAFEPMHYLTGAGNVWANTYRYAMCQMEEMLWIRTKSIHAAEFFHGTLEVIEKGIPVTIFAGEDGARPLTDRALAFFPRVTDKVTVFDTKDFALGGISPEFRGIWSPLVIKRLYGRITTHFEHVKRHPVEIRRYYRNLEY